MENKKEEVHSLLNKMVDFFDCFNDFIQTHEKTINQYLLECGYMSIYDKNLMISEYHVIDCIGKNRLPNATLISKELNMTKGAISKITAKLISKGLIKADRLENNKKEVYYTLTSQGKDAFEVHEKIHELNNRKLQGIFEKYNSDELGTIGKFLDDLLNGL
ncbi:MAG: Transcriptional regulator [Clostridia bacterium]|jgi:DNA-binding MarR family transcriptional regulator|nr:Transcriptional regulator [Clostridia bacterium]